MIILKFIGWLFLIAVIMVLVFVVRFAFSIWKMKRAFDKHMSQEGGTARGTQTTGPEGEILTDTRAPSQTQRKIIADDEGEYVDFEEE